MSSRKAAALLASLALAGGGMLAGGCRSSLPPEQAVRPAAPAMPDLATRRALEGWLGLPAHGCLRLDAERELCEWRLLRDSPRYAELAAYMGTRDQVGLLCIVGHDGTASAEECTLVQRRSNRERLGSRRRVGNREKSISDLMAERNQAARHYVAEARTLVEMSVALGHLPEGCTPTGRGIEGRDARERRCTWILGDQSLGHGAAARVTGASMERKFEFSCRFPADGGAREPASCDGEGEE